MVLVDEENGGSFSTNRALKSLIFEISVFMVTVAFLYSLEFGVDYLLNREWNGTLPIFGGISFRWTAIVPIGMLLELTRRYNDNMYIFERDRITHHAGLLSLTYHVPAIRYSDIRAIQVRQGIMGRILNYGDIELCTSAQEKAELTLRGVHAPLALSGFIQEMRAWHFGDGHFDRRVEQSDIVPIPQIDSLDTSARPGIQPSSEQ